MQTFRALFAEGGVVLILIVVMSIASLGIAMERLTAMRSFGRRMAFAVERILQALGGGDVARARAIVSTAPQHPGVPVFEMLLADNDYTLSQVRRLQQRVIRRVRAGMWILATMAATAPFVGLFGTVRGIMEAFTQIGIQKGGGFDVVSAGIAEALVTTAGGILVGVEAMFLFNYLQARGADLVAEFRDAVEEVREAMEAASRATSAVR